MGNNTHKHWFSRGYLPHFDSPGLIQSITFRLADSLPRSVLGLWQAELSALPEDQGELQMRKRVDALLDKGTGSCHLRRPEIAGTVEDALLHFDAKRYRLIAWCIMPNHVHVLTEMSGGFPLHGVVQTWKSFTAHKANAILGLRGEFWMREYHDRYIRDARHFDAIRRYIEENPVKARLVRSREMWRWSSAWKGRRDDEH